MLCVRAETVINLEFWKQYIPAYITPYATFLVTVSASFFRRAPCVKQIRPVLDQHHSDPAFAPVDFQAHQPHTIFQKTV
jgi:hypothetical protein